MIYWTRSQRSGTATVGGSREDHVKLRHVNTSGTSWNLSSNTMHISGHASSNAGCAATFAAIALMIAVALPPRSA